MALSGAFFIVAIIFISIWLWTEKFARILIKPIQPIDSRDVSNDLQAIAFASIGLYIFITRFPNIISILQFSISNGYDVPSTLYQLSPTLIEILLSIVLFFKSNSLSALVHYLRNAGLAR